VKIALVAGARPNFMKIAPLMRECRRRSDTIEPVLVHTGQHYDAMMSDVFFSELEIPRPDISLEVGSHPRDEQIRLIEERFEPVARDLALDLLIVVGDVNSTVACARVARRHGITVVHVEAGLRSFDDAMPEERNRIETDRLSDLLFVTEPSGMANLAAEGVSGKRFLVGNVMIDTLVRQLGKARNSAVLDRFHLAPGSYVAATLHRPSNVDSPDALKRVLHTIAAVCERLPMVLPVHPRTMARVNDLGLAATFNEIPRLTATPPLGYHDFLRLVMESRAVVTDSGGIQEETTFLGIPCVTMRANTERPVTVNEGTNVLVGTEPSAVTRAIDDVLAGRFKKGRVPDLWDGQAASRIMDLIQVEARIGRNGVSTRG